MKTDKAGFTSGQGIISVVVIVLIVIGALFGLSQLKGCEQQLKHAKSNIIGLDRTMTVYACNGSIIKQWEGRVQIETKDGIPRFIVDGKAVHAMGTVIIEEK